MKQLFTLFLLCLVNIGLLAQGTIRGTIVDAESNESLVSATVTLDGTTKGSVSDLEGKFIIRDVSDGKHQLSISFIGYENQEMEVDVNGDLDIGTVALASTALGLEEIQVVASYAIDRKTPVAVSTIKAEEIEAKIGNQEFPEILKATPSVYATKQGGGFGDARINVRGFDQRNTAVLINGIPVNDMENGWVYWSNWAGLSDVTRTMQVQRGLGASKLAVSSVGGTINIITKTTDMEQGGSLYYGIGNSGYQKYGLTLSTGRMEGGWAVTFSGSRTTGDGYVDGTWVDAYSYFGSIAKELGKNHQLVLTAIGAPQRHGQRSFKEKLGLYDEVGQTYNSDWGYKDGQTYSIRENFYHKPQISLNHYWNISEKTFLNTSVYVSTGRGGGTGDRGSINGRGTWGFRDAYNQIDVDGIVAWNTGTANVAGFPAEGHYETDEYGFVAGEGQSYTVNDTISVNSENKGFIKRTSMNSHNWYGVLSTMNHSLSDKLNLTAGLDVRQYKGIHYRKIADLMGNDYWLESRNSNRQVLELDIDGDGYIGSREKGFLAQEGDTIAYHNDGLVGWQGVFSQLEYTHNEALTAFVSASLANTSLTRIDYFQYTPDNQKSDSFNYLGYTAKVGANYNINNMHNVFVNAGYFSRAPSFDVVFPSYDNNANMNAKNEKVLGIELGYGLRSSKIAANFNVYYTQWNDKSLFRNFEDTQGNDFTANIAGLNAVHQGIELDLKANPIDKLNLNAAVSIGDWQWKNDVSATISDDDNQVVGEVAVYAKGLKVGDAPQTTFAISGDYQLGLGVKVDATYVHYSNLYASFDPVDRTDPSYTEQAFKVPSYGLLDAGVSLPVTIGSMKFVLRGNVNNLLNEKYVVDVEDKTGTDIDISDLRGFYGFGRTWNVSLKTYF
ncbi:MAG: TonB-dependent receptor [Chitinophagales bacterium]